MHCQCPARRMPRSYIRIRVGNIEWQAIGKVKAPWSSTKYAAQRKRSEQRSDGELLRHTAKSPRGRSLIRRESLNDVPCEQIFDHIEILNITPPHIGQKKTKNDQLTIN